MWLRTACIWIFEPGTMAATGAAAASLSFMTVWLSCNTVTQNRKLNSGLNCVCAVEVPLHWNLKPKVFEMSQSTKHAASWATICDTCFMATVIQKQSDVSSNSGFSLLVYFAMNVGYCSHSYLKCKKNYMSERRMRINTSL